MQLLRSLRLALLAVPLAVLAMLASSCESTTEPKPQPTRDTTMVSTSDRAVFMLNEGQFGFSNSSLDVLVFHRTLTIHDSANKVDTVTRFDTIVRKSVLSGLGEANDILLVGNRAIVLDNTGNKLVVLSADSLSTTATIPLGVDQPNKMAYLGNNRIVVTRRGSMSAAIVDLASRSVVDSIYVGEPSVCVAVLSNSIFITSGGFGTPGHLKVFSVSTLAMLDSLELQSAPEILLADSAHNQVIVGAYGDYNQITPRLYFISGVDHTISGQMGFGTAATSYSLVLGRTLMLVSGGSVTPIDPATHVAETPMVLSATSSFYNGAYDFATDELYLGVQDFSGAEGVIEVYDATSGTFIRSFKAGIAPAHFAFYH